MMFYGTDSSGKKPATNGKYRSQAASEIKNNSTCTSPRKMKSATKLLSEKEVSSRVNERGKEITQLSTITEYIQE